MATDKKSFLLYCDLIETVKILPKELQADLFMMILQYVNDENPVTDNLTLAVAFEPVKLALKRDLRKYETIKKLRQEAGRNGAQAKAEKKKQEEANAKLAKKSEQKEANKAVIVTVTDTVTVRVNKFKKEVFKFSSFSNEMLQEFFEYWSEVSPKGKKARFEKQPTFDIGLRLKKWKQNQDKWEKENPNKKRTASSDWKELINQQK